MNILKKAFGSVLFAIFLFSGTQSFAEPPEQNGFSVGPGVVIADKAYKGFDTETTVFPFIMYQSNRWYFRGPMVGIKVFDDDCIRLDAIGKWRFDGYEEDDSNALTGMDDRDMTAELGAAVSVRGEPGFGRLAFFSDILGNHNGYDLVLTCGKRFNNDKFSFTPTAGIEWQNKNLANYYYGVRSDEALPSRPKYNVSDATNVFVALQIGYEFNEKYSLFTRFKYKWLDSEISDSPIIGQDYQLGWMLGLLYRF